MVRRELVVLLACFSMFALCSGRLNAQALSGNYTINSAVGTGGTNFQSFTAAVSALVTNGVAGPVIIDVVTASGPYTEHLSIGVIGGVSSTNTVTFNGHGNTLQYAPTSTDYSIIDINGADYVTFDNLTVVGTNATYGVAFLLRNQSDFNTIQNCTINLSAITGTGSTSAFVAGSAGTASLTTAGNNANYCTIQNNTMTGYPYYGITFYGTSSSVQSTNITIQNQSFSCYYTGVRCYYMANVSIQNNTITDFYNYGAALFYTTNGTISGNNFSRPTRTTSTTVAGIYFSTSCIGFTIEKNKIHNLFDAFLTGTSTTYGIYLSSTGSSTAYNLVKNNVIYNMNGAGTQYGIYNTGGNYVQYYHNTISLDNTASTTTSVTYGIYSSGTTTPGPDILNNIITITRGGTANKFGIYLSATTSTGTSNYNDIYVNGAGGSNYVGYKGANYATLAAWQGLGYDLASVAADPAYESPSTGNLKPQAGAVNDIGTNLSSAGCMCVTDDILGNARSTTPDLGAYEFSPVPMTVTSTTTTQTNIDPVIPGSTNQLIIGVQIATTGSSPALSATQFSLSTNGSTNAGTDIGSAKLYYTGTSSTFATTTLYGSTATPSGAFNIAGAQTLASGTNYFWLAYDITSGATVCDAVDAECSSITISGTPYTPTPTAPSGSRTIKNALSGAYVINSTVAPSCTVYTSFTDAVRDLSSLGVSGSVTFTVAAGSGPYTEHISIPAITGASATNTITFNGNGRTLQFAPTSTDYSIIDLNGADYVTFTNLTIKGTDPNYGVGVLLRGQANYNQITNCTIDLAAVTNVSAYSAYICATGALNSVSTTGDNASYCTFQGNTCTGGAAGGPYYGIRINGLSSALATSNAIIGNTIQDFYTYGMYLYYTSGTTVQGNDLSRPYRTTVSTFYGIACATSSKAEIIEKNKIHDPFAGIPTSTSASYALYFSSPATPSGSETTVRNNVVYNMQGNGTQEGVYCSSASYVRIYHNTISLDDAAATAGTTYGYYVTGTTAPGPDFQNNIVTITRGGTGTKYCIYLSSTAAGTSNYNDLFISAPAGTNYTGYWNALTYTTLGNWQTANTNAYDQNSVAVDPLYENVAAGNGKPQSSGVNDLGTNLSTGGCMCVTDDILGAGRSATPDMGAWEFTPTSMVVTGASTTQPVVNPIGVGQANQLIIGIQITTQGTLPPPANVTQFTLSTNGSTSAADIAAAKLFYTGTSGTFTTGMQYGSTAASPSGTFVITGSTNLSYGTNYFWLVYDIASGATPCDVVDAECSSITINATPYTPSPTAPSGSRTIKAPFNGTYTINMAATPSCTVYTTIRDAIYDLCGVGVSGPTTFNVLAGHSESSANLVLQVPSASASRTITFQKSGSGTNPLITAAAGTTTNADGIIKIVGTDYVTFDGIDLQESSGNTTATTQMEWGYAVLKASETDGSQYVTIRNCAVTLSNANTATVGIYHNNHTASSLTLLTVTAPSGENSHNRYYSNTVTTAFSGVWVQGFADGTFPTYPYYDHENRIGADGANTIVNFGGGAATAYGIYAIYQGTMEIANNVVGPVTNHTSTLYGVYVGTGQNGSLNLHDNTVSIACAGTTTTMYGIYSAMGSNGINNTVNIHDNAVTGCTYPTATSGGFYALYNSAGPYTLNIYNNRITDNVYGSGSATATGTLYFLYTAVVPNLVYGSVQNVHDNLIRGNTRVQSALGAGTNSIMYSSSAAETQNWYGNVVSNNTLTSTGTLYGMYLASASVTRNVYGNTIDSITTSGGSVYGIYSSTGTALDFSKNRVSNITASGSAAVLYGIFVNSGVTASLYNNIVCDLKATATTGAPGLFGINIGAPTAANLYYNTVYLDAVSSGATFGSVALYATTAPTLDLRNNMLINTSAPGSTGGNTVAFQRNAADLSTYLSPSNNNLYFAGTPAANRLIFADGTNADWTLAAFQARVTTRDNQSVTENPPFLNVATTPFDMHLSTSTATQVESGGRPVSSPIAVSDDFDGNARHASYPDIGSYEFAGTASDQLPPAIVYTPMGNGNVATTRAFASVAISDLAGVNTTTSTRPRVYYKKGGTSTQNLWNDNTSATPGWKWVEANGTSTPFDFTIDYTKVEGGSISAGDTIAYFVVAQDLAATPNVGINNGSFASPPTSVALGTGAFPIGAPVNTYTIGSLISGSFTIPGAYASLTGSGGLFADINAKVLSGDVIVTITADITEDGTNALNQWTETGAGGYQLLIQPDGTTIRNITGTVASAMIRLNGADRVNIDGRYLGSGQYLLFRNSNTASPVFSFAGDATSDTLQYCFVESANATVTSGAVVIGSGIATGNDNLRFLGNLFSDIAATGVPSCHIFSNGSTLALNSGNTIANNEFLNYTGIAVAVTPIGNGDAWSVSDNAFYQTVATAPTTALTAISILTGSYGNGHTIIGNSIGGSTAMRTGTPMTCTQTINGILLACGTGSFSSIQGNTISNIYAQGGTGAVISMFIGVSGGNANIGTVTGNVVGGSAQPYDTIRTNYDADGIGVSSGGTVNIANNMVGNIAYYGAGAATANTMLTAGIDLTGAGIYTVANNTVKNLVSNTPNPVAAFPVIGIRSTNAGLITVDGNLVHDIRNNEANLVGPFYAYGIGIVGAASGSVVRNNRVYDIIADHPGLGAAAPSVYGIITGGSSSCTYSNNQIALGSGIGNDAIIRGIEEGGSGTNRFFYNSVVLAGTTGATGSNKSHAFYRATASDAPTLRNNALVNARASASGNTGAHYAIGTVSASGWTGGSSFPALASNHNFLSSSDAAKLGDWAGTGQTIAAWKANVANNDVYSLSVPVAASTTAAQLYPPDLFPGMATGDLTVDATKQACWFLSGGGIAGSESGSIAADYAASSVRSTTLGIATDIGSDEFSTSTSPFTLTATPALSGTTPLAFAGLALGSITWGSGGTVPGSITYSWYPGVNPPAPLQGAYGNAYWSIAASGGSGYTYDITLEYTAAILGGISAESNVRIAKLDGGVWVHYAGATPDASNQNVTLAGLTGFSDFALSDATSPLPVELTAFTAVLRGRQVDLAWTTASELNLLRFVVERRLGAGRWEELGAVQAHGTIDAPCAYAFADTRLPATGSIAYRLRMEDRDGSFTRSDEVRVSLAPVGTLTLFANYPNPFNGGTTISFGIPTDAYVSVHVFDAAGREVAAPLAQSLPAGVHSLVFSGTDLPSGVYRYVVSAGDVQKTGMMILSK